MAQEDGKEDAAYFDSLSAFVSKVRGNTFTWEQARDMTFKDIAKNVEVKPPRTRLDLPAGQHLFA